MGERKTIVEGGSDARHVPTGHLTYIVEGTLMAAPSIWTASRSPRSYAGCRCAARRWRAFRGVGCRWLVYVPAGTGRGGTRVPIDRSRPTPLPLARGWYQNPRVSRWQVAGHRNRDGKQTAISVYELAGRELDPAPDVRRQQPRAGVVRRRQTRGVSIRSRRRSRDLLAASRWRRSRAVDAARSPARSIPQSPGSPT